MGDANECFDAGSTLKVTPPAQRVNLDDTATLFEMTSNTMINATNARTVSIRGTV